MAVQYMVKWWDYNDDQCRRLCPFTFSNHTDGDLTKCIKSEHTVPKSRHCEVFDYIHRRISLCELWIVLGFPLQKVCKWSTHSQGIKRNRLEIANLCQTFNTWMHDSSDCLRSGVTGSSNCARGVEPPWTTGGKQWEQWAFQWLRKCRTKWLNAHSGLWPRRPSWHGILCLRSGKYVLIDLNRFIIWSQS